jgi:hypothetical protein
LTNIPHQIVSLILEFDDGALDEVLAGMTGGSQNKRLYNGKETGITLTTINHKSATTASGIEFVLENKGTGYDIDETITL